MLDGLERLNQAVHGSHGRDAGIALDILRAIRDELVAEIRRRYDLPPEA